MPVSTPQDLHGQIVGCAQAILLRQIGVIEGSRRLAGLHSIIPAGGIDPDFRVFIAVDSETDHLPLGDVRKYWAKGSLVVKDMEIREIEDLYRSEVLASCERLVARYGASSHPSGDSSLRSE